MPEYETAQGAVMLLILLAAFTAMARFKSSQALIMPLVACSFLGICAETARNILEAGFREFAGVAILFTAVAVPAHMVERSGAFRWLGDWLGHQIGVISLRRPGLGVPLLVSTMFLFTYITAALFHNMTSILVMVPITISLCTWYGIPSRWLLSGELVASNLGGFSTSWGDTPNIIESTVWQLENGHFMREIVPPNATILLILGACVTALTLRSAKKNPLWRDPIHIAGAAADFRIRRADTPVDYRLLMIGLLSLGGFILFQYLWRSHEIAGAAIAILLATIGERPGQRLQTLQSIDLDLYMMLGSIFVLANAVSLSWIGTLLSGLVASTHGAPWAIAVSSYLGTTLTEAASWAAAVAHSTHQINPSHAAAWALGGGICAGSSSLVTAASAGIILSVESRRFPGHEISFGRYMGFGLVVSLGMLLFYSVYFTLLV